MSLSIVPSDVLNYMGQVFTSLWPLLAIGLGIAAVPLIIGAAKVIFRSR